MKKLFYPLIIVSSLSLNACSTILNHLPGVYSLEIQQGNIINQEIVDQLRPQMTKRQVLYIMGSPMLVDVFHKNRWDYLYSKQPGGEPRKQKRIALFFEDDLLVGVQGDYRPSTLPVARKSNIVTVEVPKRDLEKTLWEKITWLFSDDATPTTEDIKKTKQVVESTAELKETDTPQN